MSSEGGLLPAAGSNRTNHLFVPSSRALDRGGHSMREQLYFLARTGHLRSARRRRPRSEESAQFAFLEGYAAVRAAGGPKRPGGPKMAGGGAGGPGYATGVGHPV